MVQRIQSIYLLIIAALGIATFFIPFCSFQSMDGQAGESIFEQMARYMHVLPAVVAFISLVTIFLYKNRKLQLKLCWVMVILLILSLIQFAVAHLQLSGETGADLHYQIGFGVALPLAMLIFSFLAKGAINKDENLIKSLDRLR